MCFVYVSAKKTHEGEENIEDCVVTMKLSISSCQPSVELMWVLTF